MTKTEALQQRKKLLNLIEQWTRAEVIARLGRFDNKGYIDFAEIQVEKKDEIRKLAFGSDDLVKLGKMWGII